MLTIRNVSTVFVCRVSLQRAWNRRFCWCCGIACARALPPRRKNQHGCYLQHLSFFSCFGFDTFDFLFVVSTIIRCNSLVFVSCSSHFKVLFLSLFRVFSRGMMVTAICMHISIVRASNSFVFHVGFFSWLFLLIHLGFFFFQKPFMSCHLHLFSYIFFFVEFRARVPHPRFKYVIYEATI